MFIGSAPRCTCIYCSASRLPGFTPPRAQLRAARALRSVMEGLRPTIGHLCSALGRTTSGWVSITTPPNVIDGNLCLASRHDSCRHTTCCVHPPTLTPLWRGRSHGLASLALARRRFSSFFLHLVFFHLGEWRGLEASALRPPLSSLTPNRFYQSLTLSIILSSSLP